MKAKEYYEKYKTGLASAEEKTYLTAAQGFISELLTEAKTIADARHVKFDRGFIPVLRELNEKYKAVVRMFEKEYGGSPIKPDGFELVLEARFPGIMGKLGGRDPRRKVDTHTREGFSDA